MQIEKAEEERKKNEKMYKTLGVVIGLAVVIILIWISKEYLYGHKFVI